MFKVLYEKTIKLAGHKSSKYFLGLMSFIESFIFPIPPDVFIIPMTIAKRSEWLKIALIATIGSVLGACLGYFIGYVFFDFFRKFENIYLCLFPCKSFFIIGV